MIAVARLVFDDASGARISARSIDGNGYMRVKNCPLTKEQVAPYLGREIPNYKQLGLEPERIYQVYRPASELSKEATINSVKGIPLLLDHAPVSSDDIQEDRLVGSLGDAAKWDGEYLRCNLNILAKRAQDRINDKSMRELSLSYAYTPVLESGEFKGKHYDIVMRNIRANHLALVEAGRAGSDVRVCDGLPLELKQMEDNTDVVELLNRLVGLLDKQGAAPAVQDADPEEDQDQTEEAVFNDQDESQDPEAPEGAALSDDEDETAADSDDENAEDSDDETADDSDEDETAEDDEMAEDDDDEQLTAILSKVLEGVGLKATPEFVETLKSLVNKDKAADSEEETAEDSDDEGCASDSARNIKRAKRAKAKAKAKRMAMDSANNMRRMIKAARDVGRKEGATTAIKRMRSLQTAANVCEPILGKINSIAYDSADQIYTDAAIMAGMSRKNAKNVHAARGYVISELKHRGARSNRLAMDGRMRNDTSMNIVRNVLDNIEG